MIDVTDPAMARIQTVLVPTDFSKPATHTLDWAADLARQFGARLVLVHVIPPSTYPLHNLAQIGAFPNLRDEVMKRCREDLAEVAGKLQGVTVDQRLLEGPPHQMINDCAAAEKADLIVMSTHGHTGLKHLLLGSVAEKVVRTSACPVLTIRAPE